LSAVEYTADLYLVWTQLEKMGGRERGKEERRKEREREKEETACLD
jgi:hypothetical protein